MADKGERILDFGKHKGKAIRDVPAVEIAKLTLTTLKIEYNKWYA